MIIRNLSCAKERFYFKPKYGKWLWDCKITYSACIYPFATICWIHVNVYLKTFQFVEKIKIDQWTKSACSTSAEVEDLCFRVSSSIRGNVVGNSLWMFVVWHWIHAAPLDSPEGPLHSLPLAAPFPPAEGAWQIPSVNFPTCKPQYIVLLVPLSFQLLMIHQRTTNRLTSLKDSPTARSRRTIRLLLTMCHSECLVLLLLHNLKHLPMWHIETEVKQANYECHIYISHNAKHWMFPYLQSEEVFGGCFNSKRHFL